MHKATIIELKKDFGLTDEKLLDLIERKLQIAYEKGYADAHLDIKVSDGFYAKKSDMDGWD